ncbi:hypothetical protein KAI04_04150 [Candidatus Pacearchaeota archaeon]|nr:hypothetical protein [Candidatus Pacearchaeota archaeon]
MPRNYSYNSPEYKFKQSISHIGIKNGMYGKKRNKELHIKLRNGNKKYWEAVKSGKRDRIFKRSIKISCFEKKIISLNYKYELGFEYTGHRAFWIDNKNPDFIHKEYNIAIEVFYSWYKNRNYNSVEEYKRYCRQIYEKNNWMVIFIDERALTKKNWEQRCLNIMRVTIQNYNKK